LTCAAGAPRQQVHPPLTPRAPLLPNVPAITAGCSVHCPLHPLLPAATLLHQPLLLQRTLVRRRGTFALAGAGPAAGGGLQQLSPQLCQLCLQRTLTLRRRPDRRTGGAPPHTWVEALSEQKGLESISRPPARTLSIPRWPLVALFFCVLPTAAAAGR